MAINHRISSSLSFNLNWSQNRREKMNKPKRSAIGIKPLKCLIPMENKIISRQRRE
jgi:hypothetical protein